jgi:biotin carboxyl carrier protein
MRAMKYHVQLDPSNSSEAPVVVDVRELPSGALDVLLDGRKVDVDVVEIGTIEGTPPDVGVVTPGHRSYFRVLSERQKAAEAARGAKRGASDKVLKSPMPGRVVKIMAEVGQSVEAGTSLMVIEAMKMENELRAKGPGTIAELKVKVGDTVEVNAVLLTFAQ